MGQVHVVRINGHGGNGGKPFDDPPRAGNQTIEAIQEITIRVGSRVDYLKTKYLLSSGETMECDHGKSSPGASVITLANDEKIVKVKGREGARVDQLEFSTLDGKGNSKKYGPYGNPGGGSEFEVDAEILAFHGKSGKEIDRIGFYAVVRTSDLYGGGGKEFSDPVPRPGETRINKIVLYSRVRREGLRRIRRIVGIETTYGLSGTTEVEIRAHGDQTGDPHVIEFGAREGIRKITVWADAHVNSLTFTTNNRILGPFGGKNGREYELAGHILGFVGRESSQQLTAIGFYSSPTSPRQNT